MKEIDHENIIKLKEVLIDENKDYHIVMEYCEKGTILRPKEKHFMINQSYLSYDKNLYTEKEIRFLLKDVLSGLCGFVLKRVARERIRTLGH